MPDIAAAVSREIGAPLPFALTSQAGVGLSHLRKTAEVLEHFAFSERKGSSRVVKEPIGVVGLITPWNWPLNQITREVGPALAAGCTMVLKPSEIAPLDAVIFAEILAEAGVPAGIFNLVNGDGPTVGEALGRIAWGLPRDPASFPRRTEQGFVCQHPKPRPARHPDVDMMSFTGSTRAGILVAKAAADTVKRVHQELGGKSANIVFSDVDLEAAVTKGVAGCFGNTGQSCNAPTRMFVPRDRQDEAAVHAEAAAERFRVGSADARGTAFGPVVSRAQFDKIQDLIGSGIREGAALVTGGVGRPAGLNRGFFVRPTVFADVTPDMRMARDEIFGPVLSIMPYDTVEDAIRLANDIPYGLAANVQAKDIDKAREAAPRMRAGRVHINYPAWDAGVPFGGYQQSGNGRAYAEYGLDEFLEIKAILGYEAA